ncbi:unnamed protein product, partial [marine sediment metagenome]
QEVRLDAPDTAVESVAVGRCLLVALAPHPSEGLTPKVLWFHTVL